jgi:hypothetical protein
VRKIGFAILISALVFAAGCGGSGGGSNNNNNNTTTTTTTTTSTPGGNTPAAAANVALLAVNAGPVPGSPQANVAYTTVTVCAPSAPATCVTIPNIAVDTGSSGLRIPAAAFPSFTNGATVLAALQNVNTAHPVAECIQFLDNSFFFGTVRSAIVKMGGTNGDGTSANSEVATSLPIHVMSDTSIPTGSSIPTTCSKVTPLGGGSTITGTEEDDVAHLGANGLLGVGNYQYDCDFVGNINPCTSSSTLPTGLFYYTCSGTGSTSCGGSTAGTPIAVPVAQQVRNPVSLFADNNGVILELPAVTTGVGGATASGSLVFGIGTQANNALGSATVLTPDPNQSDPAWMGFTTTFNNVLYPNSTSAIGSFIDSGSNGIFFLDKPTSNIATCPVNTDFYCPASSPDSLTAFNQAIGSSIRSQVSFKVSAADALFNTGNTAFSDLAGPNTPGTSLSSTVKAADGFFDWGLSFFYGRNVYTAIQGVTPPSGVPAGPFWAY